MLTITMENASKWVKAASICLFIGAGLGIIATLAGNVFCMVDVVVYSLLGVFVAKNSRTASTIAFCYFIPMKFLTLPAILNNMITFLMVMAITLCLLQGMRATYFLARGTKQVEYEIPDEDIHEVIDADFEFMGTEAPQSRDRN